MDLSQLTPRRPYLLRAFYEWLLDNQLTPHLVVDVTLPGVQVPMDYARDGQIVLNIAPRAVGNLELAIDGDKPDHDDDTHPDDEPPQPPRGGRPALRVVK